MYTFFIKCAGIQGENITVGRDTPEPIRLWRMCKTPLFSEQQSLKQEAPCFSCGERFINALEISKMQKTKEVEIRGGYRELHKGEIADFFSFMESGAD